MICMERLRKAIKYRSNGLRPGFEHVSSEFQSYSFIQCLLTACDEMATTILYEPEPATTGRFGIAADEDLSQVHHRPSS
jgi:hypothetical protein